MTASTALVTVAEFLKLQTPGEGHLELHHGEVVFVPPPKWRHQVLQDRIAALLRERLGTSGVVMCEMAFQAASEFEVWQADVGYVRNDRAAEVDPSQYLSGAPDLVVEVLSPRNTADEIDDRRLICMSNGCKSFWVVNDRLKIISVTEGEITRHFGLVADLRASFSSTLFPRPATGMLPDEISADEIF
jgi:Uma2 family endonuclease